MMTENTIISDIAIPPGDFLSEVLEDHGMTQKDLAKRMARPPQMINGIMKGNKAITPETAIQLEQVVGVPAHIWMGLESEYRLIKAQQEALKNIEKEASCVREYPYANLCKLGLVKASQKATEKVIELRKFFGVSSLDNLHDVNKYNPAFRLANNDKVCKEAIVSWLRAGSLFAKEINTNNFSKKNLQSILPVLRSLTLETNPEIFIKKLRENLADVGVALVITPHFPKTYVTGATFWEGKNKAVIMMSLRGSWGDVFWFSLFHEIGHILLHNKRTVFIEGKTMNADHKQQEKQADDFARDCLISDKDFIAFIKNSDFTKNKIDSFSKQVSIHAGIVTGRLQHEKLLSYTQHFCRVRYKWV